MVEKIWRKEVRRTKLEFWKDLGASLEDSKGSGEKDLQFGDRGGVKV
jgi:hypothetical protein